MFGDLIDDAENEVTSFFGGGDSSGSDGGFIDPATAEVVHTSDSTVTNSNAGGQFPVTATVTTQSTPLNVRDAPSKHGNEVTQAQRGDQLTITGAPTAGDGSQTQGWAPVILANGAHGWASMNFLTIGSIAVAPVSSSAGTFVPAGFTPSTPATTAPTSEGFMAKVSDFYAAHKTACLIAGGVGIVGLGALAVSKYSK